VLFRALEVLELGKICVKQPCQLDNRASNWLAVWLIVVQVLLYTEKRMTYMTKMLRCKNISIRAKSPN